MFIPRLVYKGMDQSVTSPLGNPQHQCNEGQSTDEANDGPEQEHSEDHLKETSVHRTVRVPYHKRVLIHRNAVELKYCY